MSADIRSPDVVTVPCFPTNPEIHKLGQGKQHVLAHEIGQGSLCRKCDCTGLDLHFWRKLCKNCGCRMDEHDVQLPNQYDHGQIVIGRLFHVKDRFEAKLSEIQGLRTIREHPSLSSSSSSLDNASHGVNRGHTGVEDRTLPTAAYNFKVETGKENTKTTTEYSWVPVPDKSLVERYMKALPEEERPVIGSVGEQNRKSRLQFQLPLYDCNVDDARFANEQDKEVFRRFLENVRKHVIGVGQVQEITPKKSTGVDTNDLEELAKEIAGINVGPVKCKSCTDTIPIGDVGIKTDHGPKNDVWHPNCFRCAQCDQLLVDMLYFHYQGKYYCGRHFADLQYPRCAGCDEENHYRYRAFFGAFHVKNFAVALVIIRTMFFSMVLAYTFVTPSDSIVRLYAVFSFCMATASNIVLIAGMYYKRNNLILPYLWVAVLFAIYLILQLFISLLDTANTKDTLSMNSLLQNLSVLAVLYFEIYTALIVWRVFVYICDTRMDSELKIMQRYQKNIRLSIIVPILWSFKVFRFILLFL